MLFTRFQNFLIGRENKDDKIIFLGLDNFEWAEGYIKRFGLINVDYGAQQKRIMKDRAFWCHGWINCP